MAHDPPEMMSRRTILRAAGSSIALASFPRIAWSNPSRAMRLGVSPTSDNEAEANTAAELLRKHYGYDVKVSLLQKAIEYAALGKGEIDVIVDCYLEGDGPFHGEFNGGHASFVRPIAENIIVIGKSEGPMDQGLVVPTYVEVKTMDDLKANRDKFGGKIIGGDASWGLSQAADRAIKAYDLGFELVLSSEEAMLAALKRAYTRKEWICITGWRVHPMWAQFDLKYIEDPKKVLGAQPFWHYAIAYKGFENEFPEAYKFFQKFLIPNEELSNIMLWISQGMEADAAAAKWIKETEGKGIIEKWLT